jgi:predicted nucleic acid-binding protein
MFLDSAIITKLVVQESDSRFYDALVEGQDQLWASHLAWTETFSALCRKQREAEISAAVRHGAWLRVRRYLEGRMIRTIPVSATVLNEANRLIEFCMTRAPLKTLDAVQLASCSHAAAWPLVTNDRRMRRAAEFLGYPLSPLP